MGYVSEIISVVASKDIVEIPVIYFHVLEFQIKTIEHVQEMDYVFR
jgi:hypothetical protein